MKSDVDKWIREKVPGLDIYEHLVKIEKGKGIAIDESGEERELSSGNGFFIKPNEGHQFKNPYPEPFEFLCIIPNPEKLESRKVVSN